MMTYSTIILAGLGREGTSSYQYFSKQFPQAHFILSDDQPLEALGASWTTLLQQKTVTFVPLSQLATITGHIQPAETLLVKTAGIPVEKSSIEACLKHGARLTSNTAAFFEAIRSLPVQPLTIGVTGTKGKSTTASMIYHVLQTNGLPVVLAGNIGVPPLSTLEMPVLTEADPAQPPIVVLELSSHQLRELTTSPRIAVVLDITPEHLDYYPSFAAYLEAKAPICRYQTSQDWVIYNPDLAAPTALARQSPAQALCFGFSTASDARTAEVQAQRLARLMPREATGMSTFQSEAPQRGSALEVRADAGAPHGLNLAAAVIQGEIWCEGERVLETTEVPLVGDHNVLNTLPAIIIAKVLLHLPSAQIAAAVKTFVALPHRLEFVAAVDGVRYYNDSQATTPEATMAALASFPGQTVVLLAGGSDKGVSFEALGAAIVAHRVAHLILFPPMGEKIAAAVRAAASGQPAAVLPQIETVSSMSEAVQRAAAHAQPGSIVLLSPACASFGLFKNYQDRGDQFKQAVRALERK